MVQFARKVVGRLLPAGLKRRLRRAPKPAPVDHLKRSYAQEGEDLILVSLFNLDTYPGRVGFYVDVGAHHPLRVSNTHLLHQRGWRGINIDPIPGVMKIFDELRPGDVNLEIGISAAPRTLPYYIFNEPVFNGFDPDVARTRDGYKGIAIQSTANVRTLPLSDVFVEHLPPGRAIDLLSVDVEGLDLEVLKSNDWTRFRPSVVAVEDGELLSLADTGKSAIVRFMAEVGYSPYCKTPLTVFFAETDEVVVRPFGMRLRKYDDPPPTTEPA